MPIQVCIVVTPAVCSGSSPANAVVLPPTAQTDNIHSKVNLVQPGVPSHVGSSTEEAIISQLPKLPKPQWLQGTSTNINHLVNESLLHSQPSRKGKTLEL